MPRCPGPRTIPMGCPQRKRRPGRQPVPRPPYAGTPATPVPCRWQHRRALRRVRPPPRRPGGREPRACCGSWKRRSPRPLPPGRRPRQAPVEPGPVVLRSPPNTQRPRVTRVVRNRSRADQAPAGVRRTPPPGAPRRQPDRPRGARTPPPRPASRPRNRRPALSSGVQSATMVTAATGAAPAALIRVPFPRRPVVTSATRRGRAARALLRGPAGSARHHVEQELTRRLTGARPWLPHQAKHTRTCRFCAAATPACCAYSPSTWSRNRACSGDASAAPSCSSGQAAPWTGSRPGNGTERLPPAR